MLFNSLVFITAFLPVTLLGYYLLASNDTLRRGWLLLASVFFYAYWDVRFLPMLLASILVNWVLSQRFSTVHYRFLIAAGVAFNLLLIGIFKYLDFFASAWYSVIDQPFTTFDLILPLGISFFTFQQISYLVDRGRENAEPYPLLDYALYVIFFPQLIAGPIIRHNEIIPQYKKSPLRPDIYHHIGAGIVLFCIGLAKKIMIADSLAKTATPLFDTAATGQALTFAQSWVASSSYSLQLYFDFSGYSDMAIGLAMMFGFSLPINFNAPYRAISIRDFWRRWHITLSRFLRDYLYIPLGGSRHGKHRLYLALLVTMLLGGLWHGAGWTFVIWGGLHGLALVVNHIWSAKGLKLPVYLAWPATLLFLMFGWVIFRADSMSTANSIIATMMGSEGFNLTLGKDYDSWLPLLAFLIAIIGPTSQTVVIEKLKPKTPYAVVTAGIFLYLILHVASDGYSEFLYFQF